MPQKPAGFRGFGEALGGMLSLQVGFKVFKV